MDGEHDPKPPREEPESATDSIDKSLRNPENPPLGGSMQPRFLLIAFPNHCRAAPHPGHNPLRTRIGKEKHHQTTYFNELLKPRLCRGILTAFTFRANQRRIDHVCDSSEILPVRVVSPHDCSFGRQVRLSGQWARAWGLAGRELHAALLDSDRDG